MKHPENDARYKGLAVNKGIAQPPIINPYIKKRGLKKKYSVDEYVQGILAGNKVILSQAVTLIESLRPDHQGMADEIIERCLPYSGQSVRWGITGVPGAGKSSSIEAFGMELIRQGKKLAVLAIDPSSERSKGSILGDKTRMEDLAVEENAFVRPSPSGGSLGGVARKTRESIVLCEAAGFDTIFVETVGVGQSETAVHSMVDFFLLIQIAGAGDELQGIKRGIMEMSDGIVINKADGNNIEQAKLAAAQYRSALNLFPLPQSGLRPEVLCYSALQLTGVNELIEMVNKHLEQFKTKGSFEQRRKQQAIYWMRQSIEEALKDHFYRKADTLAMLEEKEQEVLDNKKSPFSAARELLDYYFDKPDKLR